MSGFRNASTEFAFCSSDATVFQLEPSAQAPWTRTMVGFDMASL